MRRTLLAALLPAIVVVAAWSSMEDPPRIRELALVAALAFVPALVRGRVQRPVTVAGVTFAAGWVAFGAQPWELLPFRDERVVGPAFREAGQGFSDFYAVFLPFDPVRDPEMHSLVLCAVFGFVLALGLLVAARRPIAAAAVTIAAVGWPATLVGGGTVAMGAAALAAALAIPLILRTSSARTLVVGAAVAAAVVGAAAWTGSATTLASTGALDWQSWNFGGPPAQANAVQFVWNSNYDGIRFPRKTTVVLRIDGPTLAEVLADDDARPLHGRPLVRGSLLARSGRPADTRASTGRARAGSSSAPGELARAADPHRGSGRRPPRGGGNPGRARRPPARDGVPPLREASCASAIRSARVRATGCGATHRIPRRARSRRRRCATHPRPAASSRSTGRRFPPFGTPDRERTCGRDLLRLLVRPARAAAARSTRSPRRVAGSREDAVRGGARARVVAAADGRLPLRRVAAAHAGAAARRASSPRTKAGYCQHFAGAMAADVADRSGSHPASRSASRAARTSDGDVGRHRPRRPCLGRGVVLRARLDPLRSHSRDAGPSEVSIRSHRPRTPRSPPCRRGRSRAAERRSRRGSRT